VRCAQVFGPESSGKTTLALHAIAEVQKRGDIALFIDAEHAFDSAYAKVNSGGEEEPFLERFLYWLQDGMLCLGDMQL